MVVGTVCALRVGEIQRLDVCDLLWDIDGLFTLAILLWYRKNDGVKRGLFPRMKQGTSEATCPLKLIREYLARSGLKVSAGCTKKRWTRSPCEACGRLFRNTTAGGKRIEGTRAGSLFSKGNITSAVKDSLARI
eukprot:773774-Rhodomonas_salina.1